MYMFMCHIEYEGTLEPISYCFFYETKEEAMSQFIVELSTYFEERNLPKDDNYLEALKFGSYYGEDDDYSCFNVVKVKTHRRYTF